MPKHESEKHAESYTDPRQAWSEAPDQNASYEACQEWMRRSDWLHSRTNDKLFHAARWGVAQTRNKRFTEREHELRGEALRAGIYWMETPEGFRVNPNWKVELAALTQGEAA
ncbi:hypothetical protein D1227_06250 [Henriciella mobilis]|uniref:hypothetical protein n=1 Tax=Henriciella mobilis TaxID=2305467 RepID=UPI000E66F2F5|nr:hypothetical protein [Henriciella mobilis]RIJ15987.1 hypothetical protein D1231_09350 [Henriciella mobilis]RIJ21197.1 hypothetical protein D1227_12890 [Henriciella mobilis]RIJ23102.1 hypothetical protein D1227_06250 [Henriciella mobilis]